MKTAKCTLIRLYESRNMIETRADQEDLPLTTRGGGISKIPHRRPRRTEETEPEERNPCAPRVVKSDPGPSPRNVFIGAAPQSSLATQCTSINLRSTASCTRHWTLGPATTGSVFVRTAIARATSTTRRGNARYITLTLHTTILIVGRAISADERITIYLLFVDTFACA